MSSTNFYINPFSSVQHLADFLSSYKKYSLVSAKEDVLSPLKPNAFNDNSQVLFILMLLWTLTHATRCNDYDYNSDTLLSPLLTVLVVRQRISESPNMFAICERQDVGNV